MIKVVYPTFIAQGGSDCKPLELTLVDEHFRLWNPLVWSSYLPFPITPQHQHHQHYQPALPKTKHRKEQAPTLLNLPKPNLKAVGLSAARKFNF